MQCFRDTIDVDIIPYRLPENRENNREFLKSVIFRAAATFWCPFELQLQRVVDNSLFCTKQGIASRKQGISSIEKEIAAL